MKIGIVGLGTIGGSFAKAIKTYSDHTVFGMDKNEDAVAFAKFSDAIDGVLTEETLGECDLLLLALYPMTS
ncbi:MAG: prephenate dehydrogenase/arogenate dehydrogenase family protein, partial [Clostridia bacterium]|nr:prephenate dehydrogenase/arogenate dehydrogenase family protein [Clostridia bacterium]